MSAGIEHFLIGGVLAFCFFAGAVLIDLDHIKTHSFKELKNGFAGTNFKDAIRDDTSHFFHRPIFYKTLFIKTGMVVMFAAGTYLHLKMDGVL